MGSVEPGLCGACVHARVVRSGRGSTFWLCEQSRTDARFPRYPRLPVLACVGFMKREPESREEDPEQGGDSQV